MKFSGMITTVVNAGRAFMTSAQDWERRGLLDDFDAHKDDHPETAFLIAGRLIEDPATPRDILHAISRKTADLSHNVLLGTCDARLTDAAQAMADVLRALDSEEPDYIDYAQIWAQLVDAIAATRVEQAVNYACAELGSRSSAKNAAFRLIAAESVATHLLEDTSAVYDKDRKARVAQSIAPYLKDLPDDGLVGKLVSFVPQPTTDRFEPNFALYVRT